MSHLTTVFLQQVERMHSSMPSCYSLQQGPQTFPSRTCNVVLNFSSILAAWLGTCPTMAAGALPWKVDVC